MTVSSIPGGSSYRVTTPVESPVSASSTPTASPTLADTQAAVGEALRKMLGKDGFDASGALGSSSIENKLKLLKQMGDMMQTLQKMMTLLNGGEMPKASEPGAQGAPGGAEVPELSGEGGAPLSADALGGAVGDAVGDKIGEALGGGEFGKLFGDMLGKALGEKLTEALKGQDGEAIKSKLSEAVQGLMDQQKSNKTDIAKTLSDTSDKLKELLNRPQGSDLKEAAQKLGEILTEASSKIQELTHKDPVKQLGEAIAKLLTQSLQGT
jgi:hypothetical protein